MGPSSAADASVPGAVTTPSPTLENITVEWAHTGDANRNAVVGVRYRAQGSSTWLTGMPLRRVHNETSDQGRTWPLRHSGSIFDVAPGTTYEIELTLTDPDGGSTVRTTTATTRNLRLQSGSAAVDAGQAIPDISQGFQGRAPDAGAYELGQALPTYGPR